MAPGRWTRLQGRFLAELILGLGLMGGICGLGACSAPPSESVGDVLLRVGDLTVTLDQFQDRQAQSQLLPLQVVGDDAATELPAEQVLQELVEELLIEHCARDQGLKISDPELEQAITEIRGALPPAEFDALIIESAQTPQGYRHQLRLRLLRAKAIEKVKGGQPYEAWLQTLRRRYPVSVDPTLWQMVQNLGANGLAGAPLSSLPPAARE